jgi:TPR repeat protein
MRPLGSTFSALSLCLMLFVATAPIKAVESNAFKYFGSTIYIAEWSKLRHLAARGNPHAMFQLANYYISPPARSGIPQNFKKAAELYLDAAIKGHKEAQHNLGVLYLDGIGVKQSLTEAYGWFMIAAESGSRAGQDAVEILNEELSIGQKERAKEAEQRLKQEHQLPLKTPSKN